MQKIIIGVGVLVVVVVVGVFFVSKRYNNPENTPQPTVSVTVTPSLTPTPTSTPTASPSPIIQAQVKIFTVTAKNFSFTPAEMRVNKGDTVKIILNNTEGFHDLVIDEFKVKVNKITAGTTETVKFIADKSGQFEYYCSIGDHRAKGMRGTLIVQ